MVSCDASRKKLFFGNPRWSMIVLISTEMIAEIIRSSWINVLMRLLGREQAKAISCDRFITGSKWPRSCRCCYLRNLTRKQVNNPHSECHYLLSYFAHYCFWLFFLALLPICSSSFACIRRVFWHWSRSISLAMLAAVEPRHYQKKKTRHFDVVCVMGFNTLVNKISEAQTNLHVIRRWWNPMRTSNSKLGDRVYDDSQHMKATRSRNSFWITLVFVSRVSRIDAWCEKWEIRVTHAAASRRNKNNTCEAYWNQRKSALMITSALLSALLWLFL